MADLFEESLRLRAETNQTRLDLISTDLGVCLTLAAIVETEYRLGNREHAERTLATAEKGYSDILRFFSRTTEMTPEVQGELRSRVKQLRERLDALQRLRENNSTTT